MRTPFVVLLVFVVSLANSAAAGEGNEELQVRATLELKDGSRLVGAPCEKSLPVTLDFMHASIPLEKISRCDIRHEGNRVVVDFQNGDRLTGMLEQESFSLETVLGKLTPKISQIDRMTFAPWRAGNMPAGEGDITFGGVNWKAWRTQFAKQGDKLVSLPKARAGFNYGHSGNGRGPILATNVGNSDWKDYRVEVEYCVTGVDPSFNPYGLGADFHSGGIYFHVADARESHNEPGTSAYALSLDGDGGWRLEVVYNSYCAQPIGWGNPREDLRRSLASGKGLRLDRANGNKYRIDVRGKHIEIWVDGEPIVDVTDDQMDEVVGGHRLDHGGVAFLGGFDAMIWIRSFSATAL